MVEILYGGVHTDPGTASVTGVGSTNGPGGGDGWQVAATLPTAKLPSDSSIRLALVVKGRIGTIRHSGAEPFNGVVQVALGWSGSSSRISPWHLQNLSVREERHTVGGAMDGFAFCFLMVQCASPSITDPTFGATWDTTAGKVLTLWARTYLNGDSPFSVQFEVSDVQWLWFDMDAIPSTDQLAEDYLPSTPVLLTTATSNLYLNTNAPGTEGEKWLHLFRVFYEPRSAGQAAPWFQFGYSTTPASFTGFVAKVGTSGRWGQNRAAQYRAGPQQVALSQGGMWYGVQPSGTFLPAVRCADRYSGVAAGTQTRVRRYTYVGIRLDNLLDVLSTTDDFVERASVNFFNPTTNWTQAYVPLERPATGVVSVPTVFVHGVVDAVVGESQAAAIQTELQSFHFPGGFCWVDAAKQEAMSVMAWRETPWSPTAPDVQLRALFPGGLWNPNSVRDVRDVSMVTAYLVRDPEYLPTAPGTVPAPVAINPGREGPALSGLPEPPLSHDAEIAEDVVAPEFARVDGDTGYSRSWPMFTVPRRRFLLRWSVAEASLASLVEFLQDNRTFKVTPPEGGSMVAVSRISDVTVEWVDKPSAIVSCTVVELVLTS